MDFRAISVLRGARPVLMRLIVAAAGFARAVAGII